MGEESHLGLLFVLVLADMLMGKKSHLGFLFILVSVDMPMGEKNFNPYRHANGKGETLEVIICFIIDRHTNGRGDQLGIPFRLSQQTR